MRFQNRFNDDALDTLDSLIYDFLGTAAPLGKIRMLLIFFVRACRFRQKDSNHTYIMRVGKKEGDKNNKIRWAKIQSRGGKLVANLILRTETKFQKLTIAPMEECAWILVDTSFILPSPQENF